MASAARGERSTQGQPPDLVNEVGSATAAEQGLAVSKLGASSDQFYRITATIVNKSVYPLTVTTAAVAYDNGKTGGNCNGRPVQILGPEIRQGRGVLGRVRPGA